MKHFIFIAFFLITKTTFAQSLSLKRIQNLRNPEQGCDISYLTQKGFMEIPVVKESGVTSCGFINNKTKESVSISEDLIYQGEYGTHRNIIYKTPSKNAYDKIITSAQASGFTYTKRNKYYILRESSYVYDIVEPAGFFKGKYTLIYRHHVGKEIATAPPPAPHSEDIIAFSPPKGVYEKKTDSLKFVQSVPYIEDCDTTDIFWSVVTLKDKAFLGLILNLDDTTETEVFVPNFGGKYTLADVSFVALNEIIKGIPTFELLGVPFDKEGCGYCAYWQHLRADVANRKAFKKAFQRWYYDNYKDFKWVEDKHFLTCECSGSHPGGGHFEWQPKSEAPR